MAFVNGNDKILYIKINGELLPIGCLDSNDITEGSDTIETTTRDNAGWKTSSPTNQFYEISFSGLIEDVQLSDTKATFFDLTSFKRDRTLIEWQIGLTENYDYGSGYITNLSNIQPVNELISFSGTIQGFGKPINLLKEIYDQWESSLLSENDGVVSSKRCVLKQINNLL